MRAGGAHVHVALELALVLLGLLLLQLSGVLPDDAALRVRGCAVRCAGRPSSRCGEAGGELRGGSGMRAWAEVQRLAAQLA